MLEDALYRVTQKDTLGQLINWRNYRTSVTSGAASITATITPPLTRDQVFVAKNVSLIALPNAAQIVNTAYVAFLEQLGSIILIAAPADTVGLAVGQRVAASQTLSHLIFPNQQITATVFFNGAAAGQQLQVQASGWLLPRGNIQF